MVHRCREMKKDTEVKTLRNGDWPESRSYTSSGISQVTMKFFEERCNVISFSFFHNKPCRVVLDSL